LDPEEEAYTYSQPTKSTQKNQKTKTQKEKKFATDHRKQTDLQTQQLLNKNCNTNTLFSRHYYWAPNAFLSHPQAPRRRLLSLPPSPSPSEVQGKAYSNTEYAIAFSAP
jgi:hypothetical protein